MSLVSNYAILQSYNSAITYLNSDLIVKAVQVHYIYTMKSILTLKEIKPLLSNIDIVAAMEEGFIKYSKDNCVVPPVGELLFEEPKGEAHIKYGLYPFFSRR